VNGHGAPVGDPAVSMRILVAGVGNVIAGDDGFGPAVVAALTDTELPDGVTVLDTGIGGFALVRELMEGYDALVIVDAINRGLPPGTVRVLEPVVPEIAHIAEADRAAAAGDMHQAVPGSALVIARAAGALPPFVRIVGCQPQSAGTCDTTLTDIVRDAVPVAVAAVQAVIASARQDASALPQPVVREP
jgi:hydrogenase maturation protease